mmetsp:Transcript_102132/g.294079  ORF Transcript_102132/g.294079 Transcript_102132/m.294079 type:complete len:109 (-) Transcript_102132:132-458(-)
MLSVIEEFLQGLVDFHFFIGCDGLDFHIVCFYVEFCTEIFHHLLHFGPCIFAITTGTSSSTSSGTLVMLIFFVYKLARLGLKLRLDLSRVCLQNLALMTVVTAIHSMD